MWRCLPLKLCLLLLIIGAASRYTHAQEIATPTVIDVTSIPSVGSVATVQTMQPLDLHQVNQQISEIPGAAAPDWKVIQIKPATGQDQYFIRESPTEWKYATPEKPATGAAPTEAAPTETTRPAMPVQPPVLWITADGSGQGYKILTQLVPPDSGQNSWGWPEVGPFAIHSYRDTQALQDLLSNNPGLIIHRGGVLPDEWFHLIRGSGRPYVRVRPTSPNQGLSGIKGAARLGDQSISQDRARIISALPRLNGGLLDYWELSRMGLDWGERAGWKGLLSDLASRSLLDQMVEADSEVLRTELVTGTSDVVFVIAHNDADHRFIYLPGSRGKISYDDVGSMRREVAPDRTIVLITCEGGRENADAWSLAEMMVQNKLAKTVFASRNKVSAVNLPAILNDLLKNGGKLRDTLDKYDYLQFVMRVAWTNFDV